MTNPPIYTPVQHVDLGLPIGIGIVVTFCIVGLLWYLYKKMKKTSKPPPKDPK